MSTNSFHQSLYVWMIHHCFDSVDWWLASCERYNYVENRHLISSIISHFQCCTRHCFIYKVRMFTVDIWLLILTYDVSYCYAVCSDVRSGTMEIFFSPIFPLFSISNGPGDAASTELFVWFTFDFLIYSFVDDLSSWGLNVTSDNLTIEGRPEMR